MQATAAQQGLTRTCASQGAERSRALGLFPRARTAHAGAQISSLAVSQVFGDSQSRLALSRSSAATTRATSVSAVVAAADAPTRPTVLVAEKLGKPGIELLEAYANVDCSFGLSPEELKEKIKSVDAIIIRSASQINRGVFEAAEGNLKVVGRAGVGVDNVDLDAATEYGCLVVNAPTANTVAAAEHGIALLCALTRNVAQADASTKQGKWERTKFVGVSLGGKTLAIMGFGKVGAEVARRAKGLGLNVVAYDPYASPAKAAALGVKLVTLDEALSGSDFFSLHMPLNDGTRQMFNDDAFSKIKKGARIVNVARGGVIDDHALARALDSGAVAAAALDVFEKEPPPAEHPLVGRPDVIVTPHLGASTREAQEDVSVEIAEAVVTALKGEVCPTAVNAPMVDPEVLKELQPFVSLASGLGRAAVQLVGDAGFGDITITYGSPRGDDLATQLLRAMVIKGVLEQITTAKVNLVNADLLARQRGLRIIEQTVRAEGKDVLSYMKVALSANSSRFSPAMDRNRKISVAGNVKSGTPYITKIGDTDVDLSMEGIVLLVRQNDQPGIIASVCSTLAQGAINISFMTVSRTGRGKDAIMAIGVDQMPSDQVLAEIPNLPAIEEFCMFVE